MDFAAGQQIGDYQITRPLGRGGLGAVYEASHTISQRAEALKVLLPEQSGTGDMAERFRREVRLLASLEHPNIAGLHHAFYFGEQLVMVMELVRGEDLRARSRRIRIPLTDLLSYSVQVLAGLEYAHQRGVVHRDIKPANIMITDAGTVKLLDFGIAVTERSQDLTQAGSLIGSPLHMSPEQVRGERATPQSDLYSLGVTLYELIAGQPPLSGKTTFELMMAHIHTQPPPLIGLRQDISPALSAIIERALQKDPAQRFASAAEFSRALASVETAHFDVTTQESLATYQRVATDQLNRPTDELNRPTGVLPQQADVLVRHLASFIGPISKVVVSRLAKKGLDLDGLYAEAAKQIGSETERARFLRTRPR